MNDLTEQEHDDGSSPWATPDRPPPEPPADGVDGGFERPRAPGWLPWALAVVGIAAALVSIGLWVLGVPGGERDREAAASVASDTVVTLTNWHAAELGEVRARIDELGTERLREEAEGILSDFEEELAAAGAESDGEIIDLVADVDRGTGLALAIVRQELTVAEVGTTTEVCWAVRVTLIDDDGRWLADALDLVGPGECPGG